MATLLNVAQVIRRVRQRLGLSQEALARLLNATKGAVQHWERGRNGPDLARLMALRQLCPPGRERTQLDTLVRQTQVRVSPLGIGAGGGRESGRSSGVAKGAADVLPEDEVGRLRRQHQRLRRQVENLHSSLKQRNEQLRVLQDLAAELQRELAVLRPRAVG
jgi:transcriptional regulator with XRE-family HTH domain